jgi:hypothetical protein
MRVHKRCVAWLRRRGYLDERTLEDRSNELEPKLAAIDACAEIALQRGVLANIRDESGESGRRETPSRDDREPRFTAEHEGFNLHAGVRIAAGDDMGRERFCRYGVRGATLPRGLRTGG